jgi:6-phosphogluconolactonase
LNAGDANNISGFRLSNQGSLSSIAGSTRNLSGLAVGAAQVSFNAGGDALLVTERLTSLLDVYTVEKDGIAQGPVVYPSSGITPFWICVREAGLGIRLRSIRKRRIFVLVN